MLDDHDLRNHSPPNKESCWHLTLTGDPSELHEAVEHVSILERHVFKATHWESDHVVVLYLKWVDEKIASLVRTEIEGTWPTIEVKSRKEPTCRDSHRPN